MVSRSSSVGYTIMGKTADLTVVQKTTIDTFHKEGKTQKVIAKEAGCSQSSVSKHINREAKGRKRCGRKKCTSNRDNRTLERIVKQNWLHKFFLKIYIYFTFFQNLHLSLSLLPLLACTYLNNAWDLVLLALPLYVCLFKINCFMYSPIVSRFG